MNYTLHQLKIFITIADTGSITKAAEVMHLTQPAVSIQLKKLQDQFDVPLTEVVGRKLYITDFGREIEAAAKTIINEAMSIQNKTMAYKGHLTGKLKISIVSTGKYVMPFFLSDFFNQHPGVQLTMDVTNKNKVIESLNQNTVDFSLVSIIPEQLSVERMDLMSNKLFLVSYRKPNNKKTQKAEDAFKDVRLIYREHGSGTRQTMERFIADQKIPINRMLELSSNEAVKQAVIASLGVSVMPLIGIRNELNQDQLHIVPVKGLPIETTWSLIWLKGKQLSPAAKAYLDYLSDNKDQIIHDKFEWYEKY